MDTRINGAATVGITALPPATGNGCRLFCELETPKEETR